ncbi:MAG: ATP-grasp domain-containing protein [Candidatus Moranbacteria bacterium]|nr:ATP-grasp domain-containing protein [Candidatus Moranbacteria bacterium]
MTANETNEKMINYKNEMTRKISVIYKNSNPISWQVEQLVKEAQKMGQLLEVTDLENWKDIDKLGKIVLWRSSSTNMEERQEVMQKIAKKHIVINRCSSHLPKAGDKLFQQQHIRKNLPDINTIDTYTFTNTKEIIKAIETEKLKLPIIQKPREGCQGKDISLFTEKSQLKNIEDIQKYAYQDFIKNNGDYRVLVLAGKVLGVIKRTGKEGSFLNNFSQGGKVVNVTNSEVLKTCEKIATSITTLFDLTLCGIDIIYDTEKEKYYFLEVNIVSQWKGFQQATEINVAKEIIKTCKIMMEKESLPAHEIVRKEYETNSAYLGEKKFHFFSRMYLWTRNKKYKEELNKLKKEYLGQKDVEHEEILQNIMKKKATDNQNRIAKKRREKYFQKHPSLQEYNDILFRALYAKNIYNTDIKKHVEKIVPKKDLIKTKTSLENDEKALQNLSTHAINFLYNLDFLYKDTQTRVNPAHYLQTAEKMTQKDSISIKLKIYLLTHCVIGKSLFYKKNVEDKTGVYKKMMELAEKTIKENYKKVSLDNKFEFLVCTRLCQHTSQIEEKILKEASQAFAQNGNFVIDKANNITKNNKRESFIQSEHRNVLYIMATTPRKTN